MINEKNEMGFSEYLNANYFKNRGCEEVKQFYEQQLSALEKALEIENNQLIKKLVDSLSRHSSLNDGKLIFLRNKLNYEGQDGIFIAYLFSNRTQILSYLDRESGIMCFPSYNVNEEELNKFLECHKKSEEELVKEMILCDKYIWKKLTEKPWSIIPFKELKEKYNYPNKSEWDIISENS